MVTAVVTLVTMVNLTSYVLLVKRTRSLTILPRNIAPYLLRYILFVQITIVCAVSADRLCNISSPLKYKFWVRNFSIYENAKRENRQVYFARVDAAL